MRYEPNPKHKVPWQAGRKGSLCPKDLDEARRDELLLTSEVDPAGGKARYGTDGQRAYCAMPHGEDVWHGFPVGWKEVPEALRRAWMNQGRVTRSAIRAFWDGFGESS